MMASKKILNLFFIFYFSSFSHTYGNTAADSLDNVIVYKLNEDWLAYDLQYKSYLPLLGKSKLKTNSISQFIDLNKYKEYNLNFIAAPNLSLFVGNSLYYKNTADQEKNVKLKVEDLLRNTNQKNNVILTFYHPNGKLPYDLFYIGHFTSENVYNELEAETSVILLRDIHEKQNLYIIVFLSIFMIFAIIKNRYPRRFYEFSNFNKIVPSNDDNLILDFSSTPVFLFILINSLCATLILFLIKEEFELSFLRIVNLFDHNPVLATFAITSLFFVAYVIKYLFIKMTGWIFKLSELVKVQFFELLKVSFKINLLMVTFAFVLYSSGYFYFKFSFEYFFYITIFSLVIVLFRVGYLTFKLSRLRNIYLFSYLCTTEILPLIIIIKIILF
jgi:hypothetical protein